MKGKPISPDAVVAAKTTTIPGGVFDAFNEMIALHWDGHEATFTQEDVLAAVLRNLSDGVITSALVFKNHWLDVEDSYRAEGWTVEYDKPGYNETYKAHFTFKKGRKR